LKKVAEKSLDKLIRAAAVRKISKREVLEDRALNDAKWRVREAAINKLLKGSMDSPLLEAIAAALTEYVPINFLEESYCDNYLQTIQKRIQESHITP
jgi:histone H3/H4